MRKRFDTTTILNSIMFEILVVTSPANPPLSSLYGFFLIQSGFLAHILNFSRKAEKGLGPILMYSTPRICSNRLASGAR